MLGPNVTSTPFVAIDTRMNTMQTVAIVATAAAVRRTRERWNLPSSAIGPSTLKAAVVTHQSLRTPRPTSHRVWIAGEVDLTLSDVALV